MSLEEPLTKQEQEDLGPLLHPLMDDLKECAERGDRLRRMRTVQKECLEMPPKLSPRIRYSQINADTLRQASHLEDCAHITVLNLHGAGIHSIEGLEACTGLKSLILSFNHISNVDGLECL